MRSKRFYLSVVATILLLFVVGTVLAQEATGPPESDDPTKVKEDAVRTILDSDGKVIDPNKTMAKAARDNEGGFGGWYFSEDKDTAYVFMKDTSKSGAAETAFNSAYMGQHRPTNIVVVPGTHSLNEISTWLTQIVVAMATAEIPFSGAGIYHDDNKIKVNLNESASLEDAENARDELGIPASAIEFTITGRGELLGGDDLEDEWRPLVGGIQHQQIFDGIKCTIGFGTERDGEEGIILEVWPESHWPGFALREADVFKTYMAWWCM